MRRSLLKLARRALEAVRRRPAIHAPVHALAVALSRSGPGARAIRAIIEPHYPGAVEYRRWAARMALTDADRAAIRAHVAAMVDPPLISVVTPAYNTPESLLRGALDSVLGQLYPHWELCVVDDASPAPQVWRTLGEYADRDARIKARRLESNRHISGATNAALELATGPFVALLDHDDLLSEDALYEVAALIERHPDADLIYSDEDKIDAEGRRSEPYFKTDWNPELLLGQNLVSHLGVYRRSLVSRVGGLRAGFEGSQDQDLALRVAEQTTAGRIHHIPRVLYHWRQVGKGGTFSKAEMARCAASARRAVEEHLARRGEPVSEIVPQTEESSWLRVRRAPPDPRPPVSVIVPTRDRAALLAECARGVLRQTDYPALELIVVDNGSREPETRALFRELRQDPRVRVIEAPGPFNFARLNNQAAAAAKGEILVLLNNDVSMIAPDWLDALVAQAARPEVGAAGARLLFPDGRLQHAGVILGVGAPAHVAGHLCLGAQRADAGYFGHLVLPRNVSAVTAACMAVRRSVYEEVGGMDAAQLAVAFNDVDLCLKIRAAGYQIVWTPFAELYHHESASRGRDAGDPRARARYEREAAVMRERWGAALDEDPFYGPNFDRESGDYRLAPTPRLTPSWRRAGR